VAKCFAAERGIGQFNLDRFGQRLGIQLARLALT
jgi:hypothetical protein